MPLKKYRNDILLFLILISIAILFFCLQRYHSKITTSGQDAAYVVISCGSEELGTYPLSTTQELEFTTSYGTNIVQIAAGKVRVTSADCPDHYCVSHAPISTSAEPIVCLPHKLVVEIRTNTNSETEEVLDGITK